MLKYSNMLLRLSLSHLYTTTLQEVTYFRICRCTIEFMSRDLPIYSGKWNSGASRCGVDFSYSHLFKESEVFSLYHIVRGYKISGVYRLGFRLRAALLCWFSPVFHYVFRPTWPSSSV
jgi:hypothetical protein